MILSTADFIGTWYTHSKETINIYYLKEKKMGGGHNIMIFLAPSSYIIYEYYAPGHKSVFCFVYDSAMSVCFYDSKI